MPRRLIVFRADASLQMGTGHVMRCLTLADALVESGATCQFICREHAGNLIELIQSKGFITHALPILQPTEDALEEQASPHEPQLAHADWLGASQEEDAEACAHILAALQPDWLIVDHYALDACWERTLKPHCRKLMVIDDLADRSHMSDVLLDQSFGRQPEDYHARVPADCQLLCGSQYALLRPEFSALRPYSLQRRNKPQFRRLLITMGGVDKDNVTGDVLGALHFCSLPADCQITVVMGATAPWLAEVERRALEMPWPTQVKVGVTNMAQLMAESDLAIGAAGATSWERCCLGLPTIMLVLADNQEHAAIALKVAGAASYIRQKEVLQKSLPRELEKLIVNLPLLKQMAMSAAEICDGSGLSNVVETLLLMMGDK